MYADGGKAGLGPEEIFILGEGEKSTAGCLKKQIVQYNGVSKEQGVEFGRQGKNHMKVLQW